MHCNVYLLPICASVTKTAQTAYNHFSVLITTFTTTLPIILNTIYIYNTI